MGGEFGVSENLRHICAASLPTHLAFFDYDWRRKGLWNLTFVAGIVIGGFIAGTFLASPDSVVAISEATTADLQALGIVGLDGLAPAELFSWAGLMTLPGFVMIVIGGLLVGFGTRTRAGARPATPSQGWRICSCRRCWRCWGSSRVGLVATHFILPLLLS